MILIVSHSRQESTLLEALCNQRNWACQICTSIPEAMTAVEKTEPRALVIRNRLNDGYSDDILCFLKSANSGKTSRTIVLMGPDASAKAEARQVSLGADCVLRDPVRTEVLLEYVSRYRTERSTPAANEAPTYLVAGVKVYPQEHRIERNEINITVAPQEIALLRMLSRSQKRVIPYAVLYSELFHRRFSGETTNCRVLLGKLASSFSRVGVNLRSYLQVIPKSGYLYSDGTARRLSAKKNGAPKRYRTSSKRRSG